jgi:DNA modification methylase
LKATVLQGDVFDVLPGLIPGSVDCVMTSPPYWMLRSYLPAGHPLKARELGQEKTPGEFVARMVDVFRLVRAAMADHAVAFVNIGDSYIDDSKWGGRTGGKHVPELHGATSIGRDRVATGIPAGNLALIPQRLAIALADDGWIVRSVVVWHKPAPMPASLSGWLWKRCRVKVKPSERANPDSKHAAAQNGVNKPHGARDGVNFKNHADEYADCPGCPKCKAAGGLVLRRGSWRPTSSYEPVLMLAKTGSYYADGLAVQQPSAAASVSRYAYPLKPTVPAEVFGLEKLTGNMAPDGDMRPDDPNGANLRDVWTIPSQPLKAAHYAAFPEALVERCLRAGTSARGYCVHCGLPWARVVDVGETAYQRLGKSGRDVVDDREKTPGCGGNIRTANGTVPSFLGAETRTLDWRPTCSCPPHEPRAGLVLDPFSGSGRTGLCARRLGMDFVGVELNEDYCRLSKEIMRNDSPLFSGLDPA